MSAGARRAVLVLASCMLAGCRASLPAYEPMSPEEAWAVVSARAAAIEDVSAEADAVLAGEDGDSIRVDAAIVLAQPNRVRMRAWKLGHAVLDVTGDGDAVWFDAPPAPRGRGRGGEGSEGSEGMDLGVAPAELARGLLLIPAWTAEPTAAEEREGAYVYQFDDLICEVDARTLTVRSWRPTDGDASLELSNYRLVGGVPWAHEVTLTDGPRSVRLRLRNVTLNEGVDPRAFTPPPGARRAP